MGGGATTIAVFYEHNVIFTDVIPVGGNHVTSDIARGLSTPLVHAERMKTLYGHVITAPTDERELIDVPQVGEDDSSHSADPALPSGRHHPAEGGGDAGAGALAARAQRLRHGSRAPGGADGRRLSAPGHARAGLDRARQDRKSVV